jgi:hypothetical protein
MAFTVKKIDVTITLGAGNFGDQGQSNTATFSGLRVVASIAKGKVTDLDRATIKVYGLPQSILNTVTRLGKPIFYVRQNIITLSAGDVENGMSQVFGGTIYSSYADFSGMPETCLNITAMNGIFNLAQSTPAISFPGTASAVAIASSIAASMGQTLQNWGVSTVLRDSYYPGTPLDQLRKLSKDCKIFAVPNGGPNGKTVEIWPMNGVRGNLLSQTPPVISVATGMVGAPSYADFGLMVTTLYQPGFIIGGEFNLQSSVVPRAANGSKWIVHDLTYELASETPDGPWFAQIGGYLQTDASQFSLQ